MGKVKYATGIDYVSGSLAKPKQKNGHSCGSYLLGTHRTAPTSNPNCTRLFVREARNDDFRAQQFLKNILLLAEMDEDMAV